MTERERFWMTATVWQEARGEKPEGQRAVAHVILNRVADRRYPNTAGEVCFQQFAFSCWNTRSPTRAALGRCSETELTWRTAQVAVDDAIEAHSHGEDPTAGACHYYATSLKVAPNWDRASLPRTVIGHHIFVRNVP